MTVVPGALEWASDYDTQIFECQWMRAGTISHEHARITGDGNSRARFGNLESVFRLGEQTGLVEKQ